MLTSRLSLTLEKRPGAPAQVCSANKTLAALAEPQSPVMGPRLLSSRTSLEGCLSGLAAAYMQRGSVAGDQLGFKQAQ